MNDWFSINNIAELDTPALVVYPGRVKENIAQAIGMIGNVLRLRPHVKTFKNKEVVLLMLGAGISKFKCATIAEAEMLAMCFAPDVLLAYQPVGPKLARFVELIKTYPSTQFSCLIDNTAEADDLSIAAINNSLTICAFIDLNTGQNRTGIIPQHALPLYVYVAGLPGINLIGLHAYDGQLHDTAIEVRQEKCNTGFAPVLNLSTAIEQKGLDTPVIIAGGSPTFPVYAKRERVECSPGTFVYWDKGYTDMLPEQPFLPAVLVIGRVISMPGDTTVCVDIGHKSVSAENGLKKRIYFINAPELIPVSQSEEHLVLEAGNNHQHKIGDVLYGIPYHVCPTVALYERIITIEDNQVSGQWLNIARDRKLTI